MKRFENKVCIVTGAASEIGRATAIANEGAKLVLADIGDLTEVISEIEKIISPSGVRRLKCNILENSKRLNTISTSFVESRNGSFRKDDKRLIRKTRCNSKKIEPHDAHIILLKTVYNFTKENEKFRILINPNAKRFETKYQKVSPAMKQGLVKRIYSLEELLLMKPIIINID